MTFDDIFRGLPTRAKWEALGRYLRGQKITGGPGVRVSRDNVAGIVISSVRGAPSLPSRPGPWEITTTAGASLNVGKGAILFPVTTTTTPPDFSPIVYLPALFAGGTVEVTHASGYLYIVADGTEDTLVGQAELVLTDHPTSELSLVVRTPPTLSVIFSTEYPVTLAEGVLAYCLAEVRLEEGIASVVDQYIFHNPTHDLVYLTIASDP